jgi:hypothetical protein
MRGPLRLTAENYFGSPNSGKNKSQTSSSSMLLPGAGDLMTRVLLNRTTENYFGSPDSGKNKSQTSSSSMLLPRAGDLMTRVLLNRTTKNYFRTFIRSSRIYAICPLDIPSSKSSGAKDLMTCGPRRSTVQIHFGPSTLLASGVSNVKHEKSPGGKLSK